MQTVKIDGTTYRVKFDRDPLELAKMTTFTIKIEHIRTGLIYNQTILAHSLEHAYIKATQWPYSNNSYRVVSRAD